jgi:hypothetical protein
MRTISLEIVPCAIRQKHMAHQRNHNWKSFAAIAAHHQSRSQDDGSFLSNAIAAAPRFLSAPAPFDQATGLSAGAVDGDGGAVHE